MRVGALRSCKKATLQVLDGCHDAPDALRYVAA
jgi:hypothetical protein